MPIAIAFWILLLLIYPWKWATIIFRLLLFFVVFFLVARFGWGVVIETVLLVGVATALAVPTRTTRQVLLLIIYLYFILVIIIPINLPIDRYLLIFQLLFVFLFLSISSIFAFVEPIESGEVVIITIIPTWSQILTFLDLESQLSWYALQVDILALSGADELLSNDHLRLEIILACQQVVFTFDQLFEFLLNTFIATLEFYELLIFRILQGHIWTECEVFVAAIPTITLWSTNFPCTSYESASFLTASES